MTDLFLWLLGPLFVAVCVWVAWPQPACTAVNATTLECRWFPGEVCTVRGEKVDCIEEETR